MNFGRVGNELTTFIEICCLAKTSIQLSTAVDVKSLFIYQRQLI